jgi:hypothetical protein
MKKLLFLFMFFLAGMFPVIVQAQTESVPEESLTLKKANIPPAVLKAADELFQGNAQVAWGKFPYELKDFGWVVDKDYTDPIDHYEILLKAKDGSDIYAVFEATGELIRSKVIRKNAPVPPAIMATIKNSEYKDWKVIGDVMHITVNQKKVAEHYTVKLEKGNLKKTLHFSPKGEMLK